MAVLDQNDYEARRDELRQRYMQAEGSEGEPVITAGVHHLVLISSDLDATLRFYTEVLRMRLTKLVPNRDEPTSTHIFLDMGGGNLLAFFDFPEQQAAPTVRGLGSMHHVALKAEPRHYRELLATLKDRKILHSLHGTEEAGSVYFRDPDDILIEVTTGR
jgi:catechol 2,3-dioxygenase-like lactoylglutathione lyase family enzyme